MRKIKTYDSFINEGKITQAVIYGAMNIISTIIVLVKKIRGNFTPKLVFKDKAIEEKVEKDFIALFDYAVFDVLKYYLWKKYQNKARETSLSELVKSRCGVDVYQLGDEILSNFKVENFEPGFDQATYDNGVKLVNQMIASFKLIDDDIAEWKELIAGFGRLGDIMKNLDPRNPATFQQDKEEVLGHLQKGLDEIDDMQAPKDMDYILDKVSKYGMSSLTNKEKQDLDDHSKSIK